VTADPAFMSAAELVRRYRRKDLSPVEAADAVLARVDRLDPIHRAYQHRDPETTRAMARASEARWARGEPAGLVDGVPTSIKDQWWVRGWPRRVGSLTTDPAPVAEDSPTSQRLREHGAVFIGKTTMPEFGWKGVTDSPLAGVTRNPWDPARTAGGSSGGAGVAPALGMGTLNLGSDGAGSIRMPATFCGVYGLKATWGRVPNWPYGALPMQSHAGPLTRTVEDAALMLTVLAEPDDRDWMSLPAEPRDWRVGLEAGVRGLKIAYSRRLHGGWCDPEVSDLVDAAVARFEDLGAIVELADPDAPDPREAMLAFYWCNMLATVERTPVERRAVMEPRYLEMAERGRTYGALDLLRAWAARDAYGRAMQAFFRRFDLLLTPSLPLVAFEAGAETPAGRGMDSWFDWSPWHYPFNFTQQPAASLPCGLTREGLPAGLQIVAARYREDLVLRASRAYESVHPFALPPAT
jgi:aspartyl-tRNA(Asn)/glutamyl-tRNA(Gln) amidotransferase subunit A